MEYGENNITLNARKFWTKLSSSNPLSGVLYDCFKLICSYLNEGDKVCECYSCFKMVIQAHLYVGLFTTCFIKRASLKRFCLYVKMLQSRTIF